MDNPEVIRQLGLMVIAGLYKLKYFILLYSKPKVHFLSLSTVEICLLFSIQFISGCALTLARWQTWQCRSVTT